jgi:molybdopterin converting factor small subunit
VAVVLLPSLLATEAAGQNRFEVNGPTVGDALRELPIANLIFDERGELRGLVNVYLDGQDVREREGLATRLGETDTIRLVGAIAGGSTSSS